MKSIVTVNERIKDLRVEKGYNLDELSRLTSIPRATLGDYEKDGYLINHTAIIDLAAFYEVSTDYLLGVTDIRKHGDKNLSDLHLSDNAIDQDDYYPLLLAKDILPIIKHLKEDHSADAETSDGIPINDADMDRIYELAKAKKQKGVIRGIVALFRDMLRIKSTEKGQEKLEELLEKIPEDDMMDVAGQSKLLEPDSRKRRRKKHE